MKPHASEHDHLGTLPILAAATEELKSIRHA
jgi:hypothetical protein